MILKQPSSRFVDAKRGIRFFIIAEGTIFVSSYLLYAACNRSQTTRKYFYDRPYLRFILNFYYKIGHLQGSTAVQDYDQITWSAQAKLQAETK